LAFFPIKGSKIQQLNMIDGKISETPHPGQIVAADPTEDYIYSSFMEEHLANNHTVIINGRPIMFRTERGDWSQTTLFRFYVTSGRLYLAGLRENASSNGRNIVVSPDGQSISVPGGGGWRPTAGKGGYTIPVFAPADLALVR